MHMKRTNNPIFIRFPFFSGMKKGRIATVLCLGFVFCVLSSLLFFFLNKNQSEVYKAAYNRLKPGYLASESVFSDSSYYLIDEEKSRQEYLNMMNSVPPVFVNDVGNCLKTVERASLISKGLSGSSTDFLNAAVVSGVNKELAIVAYDTLSPDSKILGPLLIQLSQMVNDTGLFSADDLKTNASGFSTVNVMMSLNLQSEDVVTVMKSRCLTESGVGGFVQFQLADYESISTSQKEIMSKLVSQIVYPNLEYSELMTSKLKSRVDPEKSKVSYTLVPQQIIIENNTIITEQSSRILYLLSLQDTSVSKVKLFGSFLTMLILTSMAVLSFDIFSKGSLHEFEFFLVFLIGGILTIIAGFFLYKLYEIFSIPIYEVLIPSFALPLLLSLVSGKKSLGTICTMLLSSAFCLVPGSDYGTFLFCVLCSVSSLFLITFLDRRRDLAIQWLLTAGLSILYLLLWFLLEKSTMSGFFFSALIQICNIVISFVLVALFLPFLEEIFNIPTRFKLRELANERSPMLKRLSQEAPGTYSHSMSVAEIAENAARAIGADAGLVKVGAMYHDIGKMDHAEYFTENISLLGNSNAAQNHENINRNLSVAIIKSHVKLGVEKGRQIRLPQEVLDIIGNHHGNDVVTYFYNEAMKLHQDNPEQYAEPKIEEYAYLGQPPQTPEQAVVMLSDCSEAACRSIAKPTPNKIEKMISMILIKKIVNKQLNSCQMTITDLNTVVKSLSDSLTGRYHSRISYPEEVKK